MLDTIKMVVVLTVISCVAALLIAATNERTKDRIARQKSEAETEALRKIMPPGVYLTEKKAYISSLNDSLQYWIGISGSDTLYAFRLGARGYSGMIDYFASITREGIIYGMTVIEQNETPGLGSRLQEVISKKTIWQIFDGREEKNAAWFSEQFRGVSVFKPIRIEKKLGEWHTLNKMEKEALIEKNGVTAITGSTISTRAVINGLNNKAMYYLKAIRG